MQLGERSGVKYTLQVWNPEDFGVPGAKPQAEMVCENLTPNQGTRNNLYCVYAGSGGPGPGGTWFQNPYIGLIDASTFSAFAYTDVAQQIKTVSAGAGTNGWKEIIGYVGGVRLPLGALTTVDNVGPPGFSTSTTVTTVNFQANATLSIYGAFMVLGSNAQGANSAGVILQSEAAAAGQPLAATSGQIISVTVAITQTSN